MTHAPRVWTKVFGGLAAGAATMYVFDPEGGRRRRALARDKVRRTASGAVDVLRQAVRDAGNRFGSVGARAARRLTGLRADDRILEERARAEMGRVVSHPHALRIEARNACLTVTGPILEEEVEPLLDTLRAVPGVDRVGERLEAHGSTEGVSALQGIGRRGRRVSELKQENWTPSLRVAAVLGGSLLATYGLRQRGPLGIALAGVGLGLTARGATNRPLSRLAGMQGRRAFELQKAIHIDAPPEEVYDAWVNAEQFPKFMSHVEEVRDLGDGRQHWVVRGAAGGRVEWNAVTTRAERPKLVAWRSEPGSDVQHAGSVQFEPFGHGTRVTVRMAYNAGGALGHGVAVLLGADPKRQLDDDLARMKVFLERGITPRDAASRSISSSGGNGAGAG